MDASPPPEVIVVTAPRLPPAQGEAVYSSVPIDRAAIEDAIRLDQALTLAPGAQLFRRNDSGAANPTIQGLSLRAIAPSGAGRALVTLDGAPQLDPFGGWVIWAGLPPELIARATIIRGAGAGPYGAGALTGNVELEERATPGLVVSAEGGELGYSRVAGVAEAQDGSVDALIGAAIERSDGWTPVREGRGAADMPLGRDSIAGAARLQIQHGRTLFSARLSGYGENRGSGLVGGDSSDSGASASLTLVAQPDDSHLGWRLQGWTRWSDMTNAFVSVAPDRSSTTPASLQFATPAGGWGVNAALRWMHGEAGFDLRHADGETHELFRFIGTDFTRSRIAGGDTVSVGAYVEQWRALGPLLLSGGVRLDWYRANDGRRLERDLATNAPVLDLRPADMEAWAPTARFGLKRTFRDNLFFRAAAYAGFRPPTLNELHRPFRVGNDITEANPALDPEHLYGIDAAFGGSALSGVGAWSWSLGAFATRLSNPITNVTEGVGPGTFPPNVVVPAGGVYRVRENAGRIDAYGLEAEAHGSLSEALDWRIAFDVTHARVDGGREALQLTGLRPAQAPSWTATAGVSWRAWAGGEVSADAHAESERFDDDQNTRRLGAFTDVDLRVSQRVSESAELYLALDNAFDGAVATASAADGTLSYAAPRALRVGFRLAR